MLKSLAKLAYRLFGRFVFHHRQRFLPLQDTLKKARLPYSLDEYVSLTILLTTLVFFLALLVGIVLSRFLPILPYVPVAAVLLAAITFLYFINYPSFVAASRGSEMDVYLPLAVMHMSTLAGSGIPPHEIFRIMGKIRKYGPISQECEIIYRDVVVLGKDIFTALSDAAKASPSRLWAEVLWGISSTLRSGGSLREYLYDKSRELRNLIERHEKELVDTMNLLTEIYLIIFVLGPILGAIMIILTAMLSGGTLLGVDPLALFSLLVYLIVPVIGFVFLLVADNIRPREVR